MDLQSIYPEKTEKEILKMAAEEMEKAELRYEEWKESQEAYE